MKHALAIALLLAACSKAKPADPPPSADPPPAAKPAPPPPPAPDAAPYRMSETSTDPCKIFGFADLTKVALPLQIEVPQTELTDISTKQAPGVEMRTPHDDDHWMYWLKISKAIPGKNDDFTKTKAEIDARTKKYKATITWQKAETTADGFRLVFTELGAAKGASLGYTVIYLRTIAGTKYLCQNDSLVEASTACAIRSCESLKAL